ncbi:MAG: sulfotransferase domain-containing protein [Deltaproteobacteria bacterium]|nr:sulfotransferase domain-containing protein [Deltaproteobacteria bacterium]
MKAECCKPNFFLLGAHKAGTTSLFYYLQKHSQIYPLWCKEPHFFSNDKKYDKGEDFYLKHYFSGANKYQSRGEATPAYFSDVRKVAPRIKQMYGKDEPKFIVVLRDPVQRAWSHYLQRVRNCVESVSFERALEREQKALQENPEQVVGYYDRGMYGYLIEQWLQYFAKKQFLFILYEDYCGNLNEVLRQIFRFLGVDGDVKISTNIKKNLSGQPRSPFLMRLMRDPPLVLKLAIRIFVPMHLRHEIVTRISQANVRPFKKNPQLSLETERALREVFKEDVERLEKILNRDLSHWQ